MGACAIRTRGVGANCQKGAAFFDSSNMPWALCPGHASCHFFSFSQITGCPAARGFGQVQHPLVPAAPELQTDVLLPPPRTVRPPARRCRRAGRPSPHTGDGTPSRSSSSSSRKPVKHQMVFSSTAAGPPAESGSRSLWFSGSKGSPPAPSARPHRTCPARRKSPAARVGGKGPAEVEVPGLGAGSCRGSGWCSRTQTASPAPSRWRQEGHTHFFR